MPRRDDEPVPTVIALFRRGARLMVDDLVHRLDSAGFPGITASEHLIFESLPAGGARITELAARARMTHQGAGELVAGLEARGYLERRPDPTDGRARVVVLTADGRRLVRAALREIAAIERTWDRYLGSADRPGGLLPALRAAVRDAEAARQGPGGPR